MPRRSPEPRAHAGPPGEVRIIGGKWRGRRLKVVDCEGLRPTPDRVRVTLFNWLRPLLPGARCLDLYAGTGALGIEAVSLGASHVTLVESAAPAVRQLKDNAARLADPGLEIVALRAEQFLQKAATPHDVVFVDPPYTEPVDAILARLRQGWLTDRARIYVERGVAWPALAGFEVLKSGRAGQVHYYLLCEGNMNGDRDLPGHV